MQPRVRDAFPFTLLTSNYQKKISLDQEYTLVNKWPTLKKSCCTSFLYCFLIVLYPQENEKKNIVLPLIPKLYKTRRQPANKSWFKSVKNDDWEMKVTETEHASTITKKTWMSMY